MPPSAAVGKSNRPPKWIKPQLTRLVDEPPAGDGWLHEIKYDGNPDLDRGQSVATGLVPGEAGRQAGKVSDAVYSASDLDRPANKRFHLQ